MSWHGSTEAMLGYPPDSLRSFAQFLELVEPADRQGLDHHWRESLRSQAPISLECRLRGADSGHLVVRIDGRVIADEQGSPARVVGFMRNVAATDQSRAELERRVSTRTAQLEAAQAELEAFTYSVSHDLRAPLRHIAGFTQLLQARIPAGDEAAQRYMATIIGATVRMGDLIDKLLTLSRIDQTTLQRQSIDVRHLIDEIVAEFAEHVAARRISWRIDALPVIVADKSLLRIALTNLLSNALKFTSRRDLAEIGIEYEHDARAEVHVLRVTDNGAGFDMRYADKLFGVFQRLHADSDFAGSGVGLAAVRRIVQRHAGRVWAKGEPGQGAVFGFTLPVDPAF